MQATAAIYIVNLILGAILAGVMSRQWRLVVGGASPRTWIVAAWVLTVADGLFVVRAGLPSLMPRMLPTLAVTAGHAVLLLAAREWAGLSARRAIVPLVMIAHLLLLLLAGLSDESGWRTIANSLVWSALSCAAAIALCCASTVRVRTMTLPAVVLALQAVFHLSRAALALRALQAPAPALGPLVQMLGDFEVTLFMVALFVSVLVSFLQQSNRELRAAMEDVRQLSGMLPLCAWCKKVRDDDGYWTRIEEYLAVHHVSVTHALCEACASQKFGDVLTESPGT